MVENKPMANQRRTTFDGDSPNDALLWEYDKYRVTDLTEVANPEPIITLGGETVSTRGNITTISGASKSGKSAFTSVLIAGAIRKDGVIDGFDGLDIVPNKNGWAVIHLDTEQSKAKQQRNIITILNRANYNTCPDNYLSYNIRNVPLSEYKAITSGICSAANMNYNGIHLIVIDGVADYITDVNDPTQSSQIVKYLMDLSTEYNTTVLVIVHTNPNGEKERGHLGSECQRKSESVLTIKNDNGISYVEPKLLREAGKNDIPLIQFAYDKAKGYHVCCGHREGSTDNKDEQRLDLVRSVCSKAFGLNSLSYGSAIDSIMKCSLKGTVKAKELFKEMKAHNLIIQGTDGNWRQDV